MRSAVRWSCSPWRWQRAFAALLAAVAIFVVMGSAPIARAQKTPDTGTTPQAASTASAAEAALENRLAAFIAALDKARVENGVVGASVVAASGDRIVAVQGLGVRDLVTNAVVTPDTVFAAGSVTKQSTSMSVALSVDAGRMKFSDNPMKYVPSFKLKDPDADARVTMIDRLSHRIGLERSDAIWIIASTSEADLISLAGRSTPVAPQERVNRRANLSPAARLGLLRKALRADEFVADERVAALRRRQWTGRAAAAHGRGRASRRM